MEEKRDIRKKRVKISIFGQTVAFKSTCDSSSVLIEVYVIIFPFSRLDLIMLVLLLYI